MPFNRNLRQLEKVRGTAVKCSSSFNQRFLKSRKLKEIDEVWEELKLHFGIKDEAFVDDLVVDRWLINGKELVPDHNYWDMIPTGKTHAMFEVRKEHISNEDGRNVIRVNLEMRKGKRIKIVYDENKITCYDIEENIVRTGDNVLERTFLSFETKEGGKVVTWFVNGKIKEKEILHPFFYILKLEQAEEKNGEKVISIFSEENE